MTDTNYYREYYAEHKDKFKRVSLRFTPEEYAKIMASASAKKQRVAPFLHDLIVLAEDKNHHPFDIPEAVVNDLAELKKLMRITANNLNQIARHSNSIAHVLDEQEPLMELYNLHNALEKAVQNMKRHSFSKNSQRTGS